VLRAVTGHKLDDDLVILQKYTAKLRGFVMALILNHIVVIICVFILFQVSTSTMVTTLKEFILYGKVIILLQRRSVEFS
jgi:hypothetical protein